MGTDDPYQACARRALHLGPRWNRWAVARVDQDHLDRDLSLRQLTVLYLIREESATLGHLARRLMVTPAVITGIVDRLEQRGYVHRAAQPGDRRVVRLCLTEAGREASVAVEQALVETIAARLDDLSPDQLGDLDRGLTLLERVLDELDVAPTAG